MSFLEQIFSIKNEKYHKVITFWGLKIKIRNKLKYELKKFKEEINKEIDNRIYNFRNDLLNCVRFANNDAFQMQRKKLQRKNMS